MNEDFIDALYKTKVQKALIKWETLDYFFYILMKKKERKVTKQ